MADANHSITVDGVDDRGLLGFCHAVLAELIKS